MPNINRLLAVALLVFAPHCGLRLANAETLAYFGTYTLGGSTSEGIYVCSIDEQTGELSSPRLAAKALNPSFVAISPNGKSLYAASEAWSATDAGPAKTVGVIAFSIKADGTLEKLSEAATGGLGACHVSVDPTGQCVGVANYTGGSCALFKINPDGSLVSPGDFHQHHGSSVNSSRQESPHAHSINFNATGTQAIVADLGTDQLLEYDVNLGSAVMSPSKQTALELPPSGGPRHFNFAPSGKLALTNLELTSQVALLGYSAEKKTLSLGTVISTLPAGASAKGNSTAECLFHPNGQFAYVSNRGHNSLAVIRVDAENQSIELLENVSSGGEIPRGFGITPDGRFLVVANQQTGNVISLRIDPKSGSLTPTGSEINIGAPVNVRFLQRN
ncbi:lactonase family protein [Rhodopirellula sp. MGV]|uniref:lactonase family protein n=1 Tax=Rhodopirellula sp. MGV TaxID=2023130 RepID=UPI0013045BFE|nr:lactonase family protein [Rhodopirellula sp. MGV]